MEEPFGTKGGTLLPCLQRMQRLNEEYNTRLLIRRLVSALLRYHLRKRCQNTVAIRLKLYSEEIAALTIQIGLLTSERNRILAQQQALQRLPSDVAEALLTGQDATQSRRRNKDGCTL